MNLQSTLSALELKHAIRSLRRSPVFTTTVALTLALGIGATTAVFSVVDAVLLRPLPYANADRLVFLHHTLPGIGIPDAAMSLGTYFAYRRASHRFASIAGDVPTSVNLSDMRGNGDPERVHADKMSANLLSTLGVAPKLGRGFTSAEEQPNGARVALVSEDLARRRFGGSQQILHHDVRIDGNTYTVVGVLPSSFHYPVASTEIWLPLQLNAASPYAGSFNMESVARLAPGATVVTAQTELNQLLTRLPQTYPDVVPETPMAPFLAQSHARVVVRTMRDQIVGDFGAALWIVVATVVLVLVVTCANVGNLLLVRAQGRAHELAVRTALGASRGRLLARFFAEGLVLACAGGIMGLALAEMGIRILTRIGPSNIPRGNELGIDGNTLGVTLAVALGVAMFCSLLPALRFRMMPLAAVLREGGRAATVGRERHRTQRALIIMQVALALVLLAGSGLLARTVWRLQAVRPGFDPSQTLVFSLSLPPAQFPRATDVARFYAEAAQRLRSLPGVEAVGVVSKLPLVGGEPLGPVYVEQMPVEGNALPPVFPSPVASPGYFHAMRIPLVAGRLFGDATDPATAHDVVVSRAFVEHYWHDPTGQKALGQRVRLDPAAQWSTIVGVVESVRDTSLMAAPQGTFYLPLSVPAVPVPDSLAPVSPRVMSFVLRGSGDPVALASLARREIHSLNASIPMYDVQSMTDVLARSTARTRFVLIAVGTAAVVTLLLGAVGLYGVIAYLVNLRTREFGVRLALGAEPHSLMTMVLREGIRLAVVGIVVGFLIFAVLARFLRGLLFQVNAADPLSLAVVTVILLLVATLASLVPASRAARIDPLEALRAE